MPEIPLRPPLALIALFLSGFAGLVYEVCWIRQGALVFGSSTLSTSTVLAVFFAGLALGSFAFGRLSARLRDPLLVYVGLETAVAVLGLASIALFPLADALYGRAFRTWGDGSPLLGLARVGLVAAVLLPAATAMGATLPLMCAAFEQRSRAVSVGVLYGVNTLGAAVGTLVTGLVLIPGIGVVRSVVVAAVANLAAAGFAWSVRSAASAPVPEPRAAVAARPRAPSRGGARAVVSALFFVSGFVALAHEVLWTRYLGLLIRNTVYTFTLSLSVVLVGIVLGSLLVSVTAGARRPSRPPSSDAGTFGALQVLIGLYVLGLMLLPPAAWRSLGTGLGVYFVALLPPAVLSGASFPIAVRWATTGAPSRLGDDVGRMAALNIVGGILGSLFAGFVGLPRWGLQTSALITTGLSVGAGGAAWLLRPGSRPRAREIALAVGSILLWLGIPRVLGTRIPQDFLAVDGPLVDFREGLLSNVAVLQGEDALQMEIDRWWQGQSRKTHQIMAAHVPMLLHEHPRSVLVVGVGTGQTASRFLDYAIDRLDVVDIEPVVFDLIRPHFDHAWLDDPRTHVIREDGRNFVAHTGRTYDVVSLEVGQVFRPGVASFYTREFYARARARLAPGGLLCQFVPLPFLTVDQFRGVIATFIDVFPGATLWYNTSELLLIGGRDGAPAFGASRWALLAGDARLAGDLRYSPWGGPAHWLNQPRELVATFLCGPRGLAALSRGAARDRDDRPVLEYATTRVDETQALDVAIARWLEPFLDPPSTVLQTPWPAESLRAVLASRRRDLSAIEASALIRRAAALEPERRFAEMEPLLRAALRINPESLGAHRALGSVYQRMDRLPESRQHYEAALRIDPDDVPSLRGLATWYLVGARYPEAQSLFRSVLALRPDDVDAHNNLGVTLGRLGDLAGARDHFKEAARLRPGDVNATRNLERTEAALAGARGAR